jgi:hypothetical protein
LFGFFYRFPILETHGARQIFEDPALPPQRNFKFLKTLGLSVRVSTGLHHRLVRITNRFDILKETFSQYLRFVRLYRVAGETEQDVGYRNVCLRTIDRIRLSAKFVSFLLKTFQTLIVLNAESIDRDRAGAYGNDNQQ